MAGENTAVLNTAEVANVTQRHLRSSSKLKAEPQNL